LVRGATLGDSLEERRKEPAGHFVSLRSFQRKRGEKKKGGGGKGDIPVGGMCSGESGRKEKEEERRERGT